MDQEYVIPTPQALDHLGPGCFVKVEQSDGSFWVELDDTDGDMMGGWVHPNFDAHECPYTHECHVYFKRGEITHLGCDRYCYC